MKTIKKYCNDFTTKTSKIGKRVWQGRIISSELLTTGLESISQKMNLEGIRINLKLFKSSMI